MLATVNPCGFALLPGYLALVVAGGSRTARLGRAVLASALMTAGFVAVFGVFGLLSGQIAGIAQRYLPVLTVLVGLALVVAGGLLLAGRELSLLLPRPARGAPTGRVASMLGYGVAFAVASLSCSIAPFLAVAGVALRRGDLGSGLSAFLAYALGMGLVVGVLAVAAALASTTVATGIRRLFPYLGRIGGALLLLTGGYVAYYGWYELRLFHADGAASDPVVDAAGRVQGALAGLLDAIGPVPLVLALITLATGLLLLRHRRVTSAAWDDGRVPVDPDKESE
ncbi:cytochrome c biogenesis CcdA family protein [Actinophytocola sp.]|uniref:cytochrome c biogenesis CcdA family protein n=1 Tax=Actinophytocola sp. TaxID=1872138 RepID=UPI002DBED54B|nr:cytochrome c biogenesis protein CcdA [Actinophytocola sp.]